ncbi:MAG: FAD-binding oxidoreductase, partial [Opitutales bacterium]
YSTIGGNIATNAGGLRGAKYGVTRDYVVALEGYLPTGEPVKWGRPLRKDASGFNLRDLWVGSEGMLGVVTKATLRLLPEPAARRTALAAFSNEAAALDTVREILRSRLMPSVLEFLDRQSVACAERFVGETMMPGFPEASLLLIELDGHPAQVAEDGERLAGLLEPAAAAVTFAQSPDEAEALWRARRKCSPAMFEMGNTKLNEDIVVPPGAYHELIAATLAIKAATGLATPTFGHAADGNFHVHIMYDHGNADQERAAAEALHQLMEKVVALGGTISGEHGIGLAKSPFLRLQHSEAELGAMQRIKAALDPNNVLNPDKVFAPFPLWEQPRDWTIVFPWDHRHS